MTTTSLSATNARAAGALTGPCPPTKRTFCPFTDLPSASFESVDPRTISESMTCKLSYAIASVVAVEARRTGERPAAR